MSYFMPCGFPLNSIPDTCQGRMLQKLVNFYVKDKRVEAIVVRGSFSKGASDEYSDIDILLIAKDNFYIGFIGGLGKYFPKDIVSFTEEGWHDTNVPDFGGIGFVFLTKHEDKIIQLDIYVLPEENAKKILNFEDKIVIFKRGELKHRRDLDLSNHRFRGSLAELASLFSQDFQMFFDGILHFVMLAKYICRRDPFLACKYWYLLHSKILYLTRTILESTTTGFMFYDVDRHLSRYNFEKLQAFRDSLENFQGYYDFDCLLVFYDIFVEIVRERLEHIYKQNESLTTEVRKHLTDLKNKLIQP